MAQLASAGLPYTRFSRHPEFMDLWRWEMRKASATNQNNHIVDIRLSKLKWRSQSRVAELKWLLTRKRVTHGEICNLLRVPFKPAQTMPLAENQHEHLGVQLQGMENLNCTSIRICGMTW
jgi:hypothetical protein